jgi:enoyl-CoA hydratase/carnithine racemase
VTADPQAGVRLRRADGVPQVAEIVLQRPAALNAISTAMAREIAAVVAAIAADASVRAVVLASSSDKAFCVGADLKERHALTDDELHRQRPVARSAYRGVLDLPVPTIAAVHGYALGGGCELALACDLIVADETSVFGLPEVSVGVIPGGGGTQLLARRVGWGRAADMVFTARRIDAEEAYRLGLADRLVPAGDDRKTAMDIGAAISRNSPVGVRNAKKAMRLGLDVPLAAGLEIEDACWRATAFSGDRSEGVAAFNEKRDPDWPGE